MNKRFFVVAFFSMIFYGFFVSSKQEVFIEVDKTFDAELDRQIKYFVKDEIEKNKFKIQQKHFKQWVYARDGFENKKAPIFIYKVPSGPFSTLFYEQKDLFQVMLSYSKATQAYSSSGRTQDMSKLAFGECCFAIQDILLVSKLAKKELLRGSHPDLVVFKTIADQPVAFDGSTKMLAGSINFARHFREGDLSFGVQIPFAFKENKLKLKSCLSAEKRRVVGDDNNKNAQFYDLSLCEIVKTIVNAKGMRFKDHYHETGLGDISAFLHYEISVNELERCIIGCNVIFPTARERDFSGLWEPELGNGGFASLGAFASVLYGHSRIFNPYAHVSASFSFAAHVDRRVPRKISSDGFVLDEALVLGNNVLIQTGDQYAFQELDSTVRGFANTVRKTRIRRGPEFFIKIGNVFERVFSKRGFFDIHYDLKIKAKDYLGARRCDDCGNGFFDATVWVNNTDQVEHRVGCDYSYQFDDKIRCSLGLLYSFAGRNVPKTFEGHVVCNVEF